MILMMTPPTILHCHGGADEPYPVSAKNISRQCASGTHATRTPVSPRDCFVSLHPDDARSCSSARDLPAENVSIPHRCAHAGTPCLHGCASSPPPRSDLGLLRHHVHSSASFQED